MSPDGVWYNELGSQMDLNVSGNSVSGRFYSAVGNTVATYELAGRLDAEPTPSGQALGWAVAWQNPELNGHSVTTWSGQYQMIGDEEEIVALWLLTSETSSGDDWRSTHVGHAVFTRTKPSDEQIEVNERRLGRSHPL